MEAPLCNKPETILPQEECLRSVLYCITVEEINKMKKKHVFCHILALRKIENLYLIKTASKLYRFVAGSNITFGCLADNTTSCKKREKEDFLDIKS